MGKNEDGLVLLDVREDLRAGKEPLGRILETVKGLPAGIGLRLLATFEPIPLYRVLAAKGYGHEAKRIGAEDWEILFTPGGAGTGAGTPAPTPGGAAADKRDAEWPAPTTHLDNRGLMPPEPMVRILQTLESLEPGAVLAAINDREPMFLFPELEARGHAIRVDRRDDGVHLSILRGANRP